MWQPPCSCTSSRSFSAALPARHCCGCTRTGSGEALSMLHCTTNCQWTLAFDDLSSVGCQIGCTDVSCKLLLAGTHQQQLLYNMLDTNSTADDRFCRVSRRGFWLVWELSRGKQQDWGCWQRHHIGPTEQSEGIVLISI